MPKIILKIQYPQKIHNLILLSQKANLEVPNEIKEKNTSY